MGSLVTYLKNEQRTFAELPFNPVDSLVLSSLSYLNFEENAILPEYAGAQVNLDAHGAQRVGVFDVLSLCKRQPLVAGSWVEDAEETTQFLKALRASRRYRSVQAAFYTNEHARSVDKQFSAVTFFFDNSQGEAAYVAFRGTDGSLAGWKEDFNLAYKQVIPSQRSALSYLSGVASATTCPLILGGHSKGGNLAQYAALCCPESTYTRIEAVYDHDGPSFLEDPSPRSNSASYKAKLHKSVPESSAFGMILERRDSYSVVQSSAFALFQHHPFSWIVEGDDFKYQDDLNASAQFFDEALDTWLRSRTPKERERFIQTIYDLITETNATSWAEFQSKLASNLATIIGAHSKLDSDTRKFLNQTITGLFSTLRDQTIDRIKTSSVFSFGSKA